MPFRSSWYTDKQYIFSERLGHLIEILKLPYYLYWVTNIRSCYWYCWYCKALSPFVEKPQTLSCSTSLVVLSSTSSFILLKKSFYDSCWWLQSKKIEVVVSRGERIVFWGPNTNTNIIRVPINDRIRIRILFSLKKSPEYEYKY